LSQQERHELRIAVKRLRYGLDLFGALYAGRKVRAYRQRLVALQEQLGDNNDVVAAEGIVRQILLARRSLEFTLNAGAILGWLRCAAAGREGSIAEEWAAFMASAKPWR
jgi:CHAD domain-containing protein